MDKAIVKALKLFEALADSGRPRGVSDLARDLGLTKANVHRILNTLVFQGYVLRDEESSRYRLSTKLWQVGSKVIDNLGLSDAARPHIRSLMAESGESVHLAILDKDEVVYIDKGDSDYPPLRAITQLGQRMPAYCVSPGKALLALSSEGAASLRFPLKRYTPGTIVTRELLERELDLVRRNGYAVNRSEWRQGVWGIAAPIMDSLGKPIAAIGVWGSETRFRSAMPRLVRSVVKAAAGISRDFGYTGERPAAADSRGKRVRKAVRRQLE
jgi:DNA-binding IclR family transcriptional regulator